VPAGFRTTAPARDEKTVSLTRASFRLGLRRGRRLRGLSRVLAVFALGETGRELRERFAELPDREALIRPELR
jgi:hypothetical protein